MPKKTFMNLVNHKKNYITDAIRKACLSKPLSKVSVSDIVTYADIPRGSFYQYFEDLDDAIRFMIDQTFFAYEDAMMQEISGRTPGFFEYFESSFDNEYTFFKHDVHQAIVRKFFAENHTFSIDYESYSKRKSDFIESFVHRLDTSELKHQTAEQCINLFDALMQYKMQMIKNVLKKRVTLQHAKSQYLWFVSVVRQGLKGV